MSDLNIQAVVEMSSDGVEKGFDRVGQKAEEMSRKVTQTSAQAGQAVDQIGTGANRNADEFTRSEKRIVDSIKRATTELQNLGKTASQKLELRIDTKGLERAKFEPLLANLRELEAAQTRVATSGRSFAGGLQNTSYQLQDFIVQVNGGTDATRALAMQLPQMLVGFGAAGAAIGVVAALLPNLVTMFGSTADEAASLKDAMSGMDDAISQVGRTVRTFDMEGLYEEFNAASEATRAATIEQLNFQRTFIETQRLVSQKAFSESLTGIGDYGFLDKLSGGGNAATRIADDLGVTLEVAQQLEPVLKGLRDGTEDVGAAFTQFGTKLLSGNKAAVDLATAMRDLANGEKDAYAASSALSEAMDRMAKGHVTTKKETDDAAKASKAYASEMERLAQAGDELVKSLIGQSAGLSTDFFKKWDLLGKAYKAGAISLQDLTNAQAALLAQQPAMKEAAKDAEDYGRAIASTVGALEDRALVLETELKNYGLTKSQIERTTVARLEEVRAMARANGATEDYLANLDREIAARKRIAEATAGVEAAEANRKAADDAAKEWQRTADNIEKALVDALMQGGKSGKEYIEGLFRTMVLRPVVQAIVQPIAGSITSAMGLGAQGQGGSSGGIGLPPGIGSTSMLSTGLQWAGSALGSATLSSFGAGMSMTTAQIANLSSAGLINGTAASLGSTVAAAMPYIGAALFAAQALGLFDKKPSDKSSWASFDPTTGRTYDVGSMSGKKDPGQEQRDATAALAALTGVFAGLAGIDASVTAMIGGRDGTRLRINRDEGTQGFLTPQAGVANGNNSLNYGNGEDAIRKMLDDLVDEGTLPTEVIEQWRTLKTDAQGVARDAVELVSTLNLLTEGYDAATIERANLLQTEGEALEQAAGRMKAIEQALSGTALPGDAMAQSAAAMVREFERLNQAVPLSAEALGQVISGLDLTTTEGQAAYQSLMGLAPGFIALQAAQEQMYNGLLTDEQRLSKAADEYAEAFKKLGVAMPENREGLLDLLGSFDKTTESGARLYAQILTLGAGFLETRDAAKQLEEQRTESYRKLLSDEENLALDRKNLADEFEKLGYTLPKSKDQLRGWIDALNNSADVAGTEKERLQKIAEAYDKTFGGSTGFEAFINSAGQTEEEARNTANGLIALIEATLDYQAALDKSTEAARKAREEATRAYTATALDRRTAAIESLRSPDELAARDARQLAESSRGLTSSFEKLGFALPNSIEELRGFFEQIGGLPNWASTGPTAENALLDLVAPFIEYMALKDKVLGIDEATSSDDAIERARDNLRAAYEDQRASLEKTRDAMRSFVDSLKQYRTSLLMGDKSPLNPLEKYRLALAEFETASALAATGDEEALGKLKSVSDAFLDASRQMYASGDAYSADFDKVLSALDAAGIAATIEETLAQQSLDQLELQVGALIDINESVLSVEQAIKELIGLIGGVSTGGVGNFVSDSYIGKAYQTVLGRAADDGGLAYWKQQLVSGAVAPENFNRALAEGALNFDISAYKGNVPVSTLDASQKNALAWLKANAIPGYADGGMHSGGLRLVGERGMEIEATGPARYWSFNQTQQMLGSNPELVAEVRALRDEVAALRQQQANEHREAVAANYDANDRNAARISESTERADRQRRTAERFA